MTERIVVVAAVIEENGKFLVARRLEGTHLAGFWEFPGGKVHDGETHEEALAREIAEELSSGISDLRRIFHTAHTYPERTVDLHFYQGGADRSASTSLGTGVAMDYARRVRVDGVSSRGRKPHCRNNLPAKPRYEPRVEENVANFGMARTAILKYLGIPFPRQRSDNRPLLPQPELIQRQRMGPTPCLHPGEARLARAFSGMPEASSSDEAPGGALTGAWAMTQ